MVVYCSTQWDGSFDTKFMSLVPCVRNLWIFKGHRPQISPWLLKSIKFDSFLPILVVEKANRYFVLCYSYYAYGDTSFGTLIKAIGPSYPEISCAARARENTNSPYQARDFCLIFAIQPFLGLTTPVWHIEIGFKCLRSTVLQIQVNFWPKFRCMSP